MKLKKLKIAGFKSFADKITIDFDREILAIVGPNGCGKSNIVDAMRWVMGEQSAKSLRGDKMHDVLFAGTANRKPLNLAEVSITLTDVENTLQTPYEEVTITRRLHRSGESEYLINRQNVRLRDIHDLLLGSGLGKSAFSIFEQGKLDQVINLNPLQRREIFDEAAGTSRFLQRKKESMRKLAQVSDNYDRVKAVHTEVEKQARLLKRQAAQAKNFQENQKELIHLEQAVLITKWHLLTDKGSEADERLRVLSEKVKKEHLAICGFEERLEKIKASIGEKERATKTAQKALYQAQTAVQIYTSEISQQKTRLQEIEKRDRQIVEEIDNLKRSYSSAEREIESKRLLFAERDREKAALEKQKAPLEHKLATHKEQLKQQQKAYLDSLQMQGQLRSEWLQAQLRQESLAKSIEEKQGESACIKALIEEKRLLVENLSSNIDQLQAKADSHENELKKRQEVVALQTQKLNEAVARDKVFKEQFQKVSKGAKRLLEAGKEVAHPLFGKIEALFALQKHPQTRMYANTLVVQARKDLDQALHFAKKEKLSGFSLLCLEGKSKRELEGYFLDYHDASQVESIEVEPIDVLKKEREGGQKQEEQLQRELKALKETLRKEEMVLVQENFALQRGRSDLTEVQKQLKQLQAEEKEKASLTALQKAFETKQAETERLSEAVHQAEKACEVSEEKQHHLSAELNAAQIEWQGLKQAIQLFEARDQHNRQQEERLEKERLTLKQNMEKTHKRLEERTVALEAGEKELAVLQESVDQSEAALHTLHSEQQEKETQLKERRQALGESEAERHHLELLLAEESSSKRAIEQELIERHRITPEQIGKIEITLEMELKEAEAKIRALRVSVDRAGAVNLTAIEEYKEVEERFVYLDQQLKDLEVSKRDLESVISKLDIDCRKRFKETFEQVRTNFHKNFAILFKGGEADLTFTDSSDVLEAGVEIIAKPPGKQMRAISLLSGGEKCLTALALLFAIFEVKPAPFCILDEVDAPLDDTNVGRFTEVLRQFTDKTQFLVVTHNKKTMGIADTLLGVSMEEKGISKLISLAFENNRSSLAGV